MAIQIEQTAGGGIDVVAADIADFVEHFSAHLSPEGVLLATELRPSRGRELSLTMRLEDGFELVRAVAMVAWQRDQRIDSQIQSCLALHFLTVESGGEFLQRLAAEHEAAGGLAFSAERSAPMSTDGEPPAPDALDQMMARRGDLRPTAELGAVPEAPLEETQEEEAGPEFAPGFGQSDMWDANVPVEMPDQVNDWLAENDVPLPPIPAGDQAVAASSRQPTASPAASPAVAPGAPTPPMSPADAPPVPKRPLAADGPGTNSPMADDLPWPPTEPGAAHPSAPSSGASVDGSKSRRPGPIKMKLAADRQPVTNDPLRIGEHDHKQSSSFVEASRKATELISESTAPPMPSTPGDVQPAGARADASRPRGAAPRASGSISSAAAALSTVAIKPGELAKMMDQSALEQALASEPPSSSGTEPPADWDRTSAVESTLVTPLPTQPATASDIESKESGSQLSLDPTLLSEEPSSSGDRPAVDPALLEAQADYEYPQEDKTPMVVIGVIVAAIVIAIVVWSLIS